MVRKEEHEETLSEYKARLQAAQYRGRPLIEQINNRWKAEEVEHPYIPEEGNFRELAFCDLEEEGSCASITQSLLSSRRLRRMIAVALLVGLALYYFWQRFPQPHLDEEWAYKEGFLAQEDGTYGIARGGDTDVDLVRLQHLDPGLIPGGRADPGGRRRLVFVGDVHGCKTELMKLLEKAGFDEETDHLILTGDVISKGPDNVGVLDELIRLKATSVRGNHEDRLLHIAESRGSDLPPPSERQSSKGFAKDVALLNQLRPHHVQYLREMPLMLHIAPLPLALPPIAKARSPIAEHILVVHAGLVPGVVLSKQDPYFVMNMRSINRRTHVPSALRSPDKRARPWFDVWAWYNNRLFKRLSLPGFNPFDEFKASGNEMDIAPPGVGDWFARFRNNFFHSHKVYPSPLVTVYGHDSKMGLQIQRWSKGLDSGCVGGGQLTALVLGAQGTTELFHVDCKNHRA